MHKTNNTLPILLILLFIFTLTTASWMAFDAGWVMSQNEIQGSVLSEAKTIDAFDLIDNKQRPFTLQNLKHKWSLLFFGYTHCADDCQTTMDTLNQVHFLLSGHLAEPPQVVFVSVDYERDKPERLNEYLSHFGDGFVGVTGSADSLAKLAANLAGHFKKSAKSSGIDDQIAHTTSIILVNPEARVTAILSAPYRVADLHNDIMTIIEN
jgi:protein SCO1/2